jgi:hypothetical protein
VPKGLRYAPECSVVGTTSCALPTAGNRRLRLWPPNDLHVAERHGGDCEYASFAEPPSDLFILPSGDVEPVVSGTADNLRNIACQLGILLADEENGYE